MSINRYTRPIVKWPGGKTQLLPQLLERVPLSYNRYVEPFQGGGALFFSLNPKSAVLSDVNPEQINMYRMVQSNVEDVIKYLLLYKNTREMFYQVRALDWMKLSPPEAAARMIYLNHTAFNGLYRVNRHGQFNAAFGKYKNPKICDAENLRRASVALKGAKILCSDFADVLKKNVSRGDLVFLDPPYLPLSDTSGFIRYTKQTFTRSDHQRLANLVSELHERGAYILMTQSNHPYIHELYAGYSIEVFETRRNICGDGSRRKGEDVVITIPPA